MILFDLYIRGGFLMHFILLCSIIGISIFIYKFLDYKKIYNNISEFSFFKRFIGNDIKTDEEFEIFWAKKTSEIEEGISTLNLMANISTLLGLTGTVTGMIKTFMIISNTEFASPKLLANGIWEALITTAFGLFVAIPLHIGVHYLEKKADMLMFIMKERILELKNEIGDTTKKT